MISEGSYKCYIYIYIYKKHIYKTFMNNSNNKFVYVCVCVYPLIYYTFIIKLYISTNILYLKYF